MGSSGATSLCAETNDDNETEVEQEDVLDEKVIAILYPVCSLYLLVGVSILALFPRRLPA
jgi:hypothetical protein